MSSRFLTRKPPLHDEENRPKLVDTSNALDMSEILPRANFPRWEVIVVAACVVAYLIITEVAHRLLLESPPCH